LQEFLNWTIDSIRSDKLLGSWLEERKFDWTPLVAKSINNLLFKNCTVLVATDKEREWFLQYILGDINNPKHSRPFLPFYDFRSICPKVESISTDEELRLVKDMLNISFPSGYCFWYIGRGHNHRANLPKMSQNSLLWVMDDEVPSSFSMKNSDEALDMKLLQMYRLYNKTLSSVMFGEIFLDR
jgi:hypothetical protein